jgi:hypothetical protein
MTSHEIPEALPEYIASMFEGFDNGSKNRLIESLSNIQTGFFRSKTTRLNKEEIKPELNSLYSLLDAPDADILLEHIGLKVEDEGISAVESLDIIYNKIETLKERIINTAESHVSEEAVMKKRNLNKIPGSLIKKLEKAHDGEVLLEGTLKFEVEMNTPKFIINEIHFEDTDADFFPWHGSFVRVVKSGGGIIIMSIGN